MASNRGGNVITWSGGGPGTGVSPYVPQTYKPSGYTPWGPTSQTSSAGSYTNVAPGGVAGNTNAPKKKGVLEDPGALEGVWGDIKGRLNAPSQMSGYSAWATPQLQQQSNLERLYASGWDNPWYQRARDKGQRELENRMSAAGVFGSGANARAMLELEADLGAHQANEMAGLAGAADSARIARFGEGRSTAMGTDSVNLQRDLGLANIGGAVQDAFEGREGGRFDRALQLGDRFASVFTQMRGADMAEQGKLREDMIQSLVAEGQMDYQAAADAIDEALAGAGIFVQGYGNRPGATTTKPATNNPTSRDPEERGTGRTVS